MSRIGITCFRKENKNVYSTSIVTRIHTYAHIFSFKRMLLQKFRKSDVILGVEGRKLVEDFQFQFNFHCRSDDIVEIEK